MNAAHKFFAFISYRHTDIKAAKKLQSMLEAYNLPTEIRKLVPGAPSKFKVFRDTDELTSGVLSEELQKKLDESKFLIVICSPDSAKSKYVGDEIAYFRSKDLERNIIPFIIDGEPHSKRECFNPELTRGGLELLGIDVQKEQGRSENARFRMAFIRLVAKMLGLDRGILWDRWKRRRKRQVVSAAIMTCVVTIAIIFFALKAQREKPFDSTIALHEAGDPTSLPLSNDGRDSLYIYLSDNDVRGLRVSSLSDSLSLLNIPGRYRNQPTRVVCSAFGCFPVDTNIERKEDVLLNITRNPEIFGRIRHIVVEKSGIPVVGAYFTIGSTSSTTDAQGFLDMQIPLAEQQPNGYKVNILHNGKERTVAFQPELDPILDRTETTTIMLE